MKMLRLNENICIMFSFLSIYEYIAISLALLLEKCRNRKSFVRTNFVCGQFYETINLKCILLKIKDDGEFYMVKKFSFELTSSYYYIYDSFSFLPNPHVFIAWNM
eukprot:snap_masked-scaffold_5-processed-gene-19.22-mRNA-1 protein AED:1.00 eAED:1.00 QI:0/0/0/0/1/1/3/0/104